MELPTPNNDNRMQRIVDRYTKDGVAHTNVYGIVYIEDEPYIREVILDTKFISLEPPIPLLASPRA